MRIDPFFEKQPPIEFIEDLKAPVHSAPPPNFGKGKLGVGEISVKGFYVKEKFPDPEGLLDTAYLDFELFGRVCSVLGESYPISFKKGEVKGSESYRIITEESGVTVISEDTEGARRAIVYLEGEMTAREGAILPLGEITRAPHIKTRITRGFFSPTNRAPKWGDELLDDIEYYPDEYLNRLAHSGTNGLWIYTSFRQLVKSDMFPDDPVAIEKRMKKLARVVAKCKSYGVKVYVFAIEPMGLLEEEKHFAPELLLAPKAHTRYPICPRIPKARDYVIGCVEKIFSEIPDLAGYIDITAGERPTTCASVVSYRKCPNCSRYSRGENLAYACDLIKEGLRRAGTGAEFISWTYGHRYWRYEDIDEYIEKVPDDVILMQNFEDRGYNEQLGKPRIAFDYWLSYAGPSELYEKSAATAMREGKTMYAKMQVCTSHEMATIPYIPAPGIIFDKYRAAKEMNVRGVMECWYFGNYPSVMSRASGDLSFTEDFSSKTAFLENFATRVYGKTLGKEIARAWEKFELGYVSYPTNIMFSYYGPMHDGVVWELSLIPKNRHLSRSWLLLDVPDGDRIGECHFAGHTLDEIITLSNEMKKHWREGMELLPKGEGLEYETVCECIGILIDSGNNILEFYKKRGDLGRVRTDAKTTLNELETIVKKEIENSARMAELCKKDKRLGYHSEAEGFKFFPEKLRSRIAQLESLLGVEIPEVRARIDRGENPLGYYFAEGEECYSLGERYKLGENEFKLSVDKDEMRLDIYSDKPVGASVYYEFEPGMPECGVEFGVKPNRTVHIESLDENESDIWLEPGALSHQSAVGERGKEELRKYRLEYGEDNGKLVTTVYRSIPKERWNGTGAIKARITVNGTPLKVDPDPVRTLGMDALSPEDYAFFM